MLKLRPKYNFPTLVCRQRVLCYCCLSRHYHNFVVVDLWLHVQKKKEASNRDVQSRGGRASHLLHVKSGKKTNNDEIKLFSILIFWSMLYIDFSFSTQSYDFLWKQLNLHISCSDTWTRREREALHLKQLCTYLLMLFLFISLIYLYMWYHTKIK